MTTRTKGLTIAVLLALCLAAGILRNAGAASAVDTPTTIALKAPRGGTTTSVDVGRRGDRGPGDFSVTTGAPLRDAATNGPAGRLDVIETILSRNASALRATVLLEAGTIEIDGLFNPRTGSAELAVTGGTGDYATARGVATLKINERTGAAALTLSVLP